MLPNIEPTNNWRPFSTGNGPKSRKPPWRQGWYEHLFRSESRFEKLSQGIAAILWWKLTWNSSAEPNTDHGTDTEWEAVDKRRCIAVSKLIRRNATTSNSLFDKSRIEETRIVSFINDSSLKWSDDCDIGLLTMSIKVPKNSARNSRTLWLSDVTLYKNERGNRFGTLKPIVAALRHRRAIFCPSPRSCSDLWCENLLIYNETQQMLVHQHI